MSVVMIQITSLSTDDGANAVYMGDEKLLEYTERGDSAMEIICKLKGLGIISSEDVSKLKHAENIVKCLKMVENMKVGIRIKHEYAATVDFYEHVNGISESEHFAGLS